MLSFLQYMGFLHALLVKQGLTVSLFFVCQFSASDWLKIGDCLPEPAQETEQFRDVLQEREGASLNNSE